MSISPCHLSRFPIEFQLACQCCRVEPQADEISRLLQRIDTADFLDLVLRRHRIGPLAHAVLKQLPAAALPAGLLDSLSAAARDNAIKSLHAQRTLALLARWFAEEGMTWMPFKGPTLAQRYYRHGALRHVNDLDIWVPRADLSRARALLQRHGFVRDLAIRHWDLAERGPRHRDYLMRYYHEEHHLSGEFGLLELHWRLTSAPSLFRLAPQQMLERAGWVEWGGVPLRVMDDVDLLLYLCEHGGGHGWYRLKWLADLPRILAHGPWDWPAVFERARQLGCARALLLGLTLCEALFGWVPPEPVLERQRRMRSLPFVLRVVARSLRAPGSDFEAGAVPSLAFRWYDFAKALLLSPSAGAVSEQLWRRALSPNDMRVVNLPDRWFGLYYPLRPILFALRYRRG